MYGGRPAAETDRIILEFENEKTKAELEALKKRYDALWLAVAPVCECLAENIPIGETRAQNLINVWINGRGLRR